MTRFALLTRFVLAAALAAAVPAPAVAGPDREPAYARGQRAEQSEQISRTFRVDRDGALDVQNVAGDIDIRGGGGNEIRIEATKRVRHGSDSDARRLLEALRVEINQVGGRVEIRTIYPRNSGRISASVDYRITVPSEISVSAKSISGDVRVAAVRGEVRAESVSGDLDVSETPRLAVAKTVSGDVTARSIGADVHLTLGTVSGTVIANGLKVRTLEAGAVSGDVRLTGLEVERLEAKSVSGDIEFGGRLSRGGRYEFTSHSGDVRIGLAGDTGFELDASTFSGSVRSDFPITLRSTGGREDRDNRRSRSGQTIRGSYGDAGAILSVRSFSGTVVVTKR